MALVQCGRQIIVHEFDYRMDGITTGTLFLLDSTRHDRLIAFESAHTCLKTPWHGSWEGGPEQLELNFDFPGRPEKAAFKWAQVTYRPEWCEHQGDDYMNRRIQMKKRQRGDSNSAECFWLL